MRRWAMPASSRGASMGGKPTIAPEPLRYWTRGETRAVSPNDARFARKIALWKKLPLPVANLLGPALSRGLG